MRRIRLSDEEGSTLVETAISSTLLIAIVIGCMQTCIALYTYHYTAQAARMATRYAMVRGSTSCTTTPNLANCNATSSQIASYVQALGFPGITVANLSVTTTWCASNGTKPATWAACTGTSSNAPGNLVKVVVTYPHKFAIPFMSSLAVNVSSTSQAVISQ